MDELAGRRVLVLGLGVTGRSAARFCAERGARVVAADEREPAALSQLDSLPRAVETRLGRPFPDPAGFDLVVPSPGVPRERYHDRAAEVAGDVELAFRHLSVPVIAVTGTNGKSTTTRLIEAMLAHAGLRARAAGNLGDPALGLVGEALDVAVLEVSSFQLEAVSRFHPRVAVVLNLSEDHLDRHGSFQAYADAKARVFENQTPEDVAILNADDPELRRLAARTRARVRWFRASEPVDDGAWWDAEALLLADPDGLGRFPVERHHLAGRHNRENAAAALLAAAAVDADPARAVRALFEFRGLPHRAELVACVGGVRFVNDSKATNPGAALRSLGGFASPVVWIAGGRDKGLDLAALAGVCPQLRGAVLLGEARPKLAALLAGQTEVREVDELEQAVEVAASLARPGDVVLLAPACASLDQFRSFEERGERFRAAVLARLGGRLESRPTRSEAEPSEVPEPECER
ncbi:MAG: UDP-N-acetylmuramoyl-L-alanine--D-glutamate ligase [Myxococcota bacterium]